MVTNGGAISNDRASIGVTLRSAPPLGTVHLRFSTGVSVLYGVNGAGKSAVLAGLKRAVSGLAARDGEAWLHIRIAHPEDRIGTTRRTVALTLRDAVAAAARDRRFDEDDDNPFVPSQDVAYCAPLVEMVERYLIGYFGDDLEPDLLAEIAHHGCFSLVATGTGDPRWDVWISARPSPGDGLFSRYTQELAQTWADWTTAGRRDDSLFQNLISAPLGPVLWPDRDVDDRTPLDWLSHAWAPFPVARAGVLMADGASIFPVIVEESTSDSDELTLNLLRAVGRSLGSHIVENNGELTLSPAFRSWLADLEGDANSILATLLADAPRLRCRTLPPQDWLLHAPMLWEAQDRPSRAWVPLSALSQAQHRWAALAVAAALLARQQGEREAIITLDEPEAALHALAVRHLVNGLKRLSTDLRAPTIVATHSRELLAEPAFVLHHVSRDPEGETTVTEMESPFRREVEELGLQAADLLQMYRVFMLVEGVHDELVIGGFIGGELDASRTRFLSLRGATQLKSLTEARLLYEFTTATLVVVLDNIRIERFRRAWDGACRSARSGDLAGAKRLLEETIKGVEGDPKPAPEERLLQEFCWRVLESGRFERFAIFGLAKDDIIKYLPAQEFVRGATDWDELEKQYIEAGGPERFKNFKRWLTNNKGADFSDEHVKAAVDKVSAVPQEFGNLANECLRIALGSSASTAGTEESDVPV
jgi:predicted ATPase